MKIDIKNEIAEKLKKRIDSNKDYNDLEEYINYILTEVCNKLKEKENEKKVYSAEDEERVKKRLRGLGYLE